ncbi:TetR/AcrR family transcriptional regulator C-terminal domain-containing protein [Furfurilactobacillus siliginis]|uniref:HTH tetR-type domain-containing protein n=1 Tax=Furfurilactobacillus siliginis TaxID=348151 RepID=A0A0R2LF91_9LACO|nr:TetR/AcrR family transcriptional regulator C-terminal domain-containing protein [Furfurilactobacillus siliginis]KRN97229.1 hypothetical protein IV55_GL000154 [Furfurilactobacillus siliginis]GEK29118.1 hypothetical protein LSI01_14290 [Furfurilactobacillus siliginis]
MADDTRQQIVQTFLRLTETRSVAKISVVQLMNEVGLERETYYYYFDDKYALIEATLHTLLFSSYSAILGTDGLDAANNAVLESIVQHQNFYKDLLSNQNEYMFKRIYCGVSLMAMEKYLATERGSISDDIKFAAKFYVYAVNNIVYEWVQQGLRGDIDTLVARFHQCLPAVLAPYFINLKSTMSNH